MKLFIQTPSDLPANARISKLKFVEAAFNKETECVEMLVEYEEQVQAPAIYNRLRELCARSITLQTFATSNLSHEAAATSLARIRSLALQTEKYDHHQHGTPKPSLIKAFNALYASANSNTGGCGGSSVADALKEKVALELHESLDVLKDGGRETNTLINRTNDAIGGINDTMGCINNAVGDITEAMGGMNDAMSDISDAVGGITSVVNETRACLLETQQRPDARDVQIQDLKAALTHQTLLANRQEALTAQGTRKYNIAIRERDEANKRSNESLEKLKSANGIIAALEEDKRVHRQMQVDNRQAQANHIQVQRHLMDHVKDVQTRLRQEQLKNSKKRAREETKDSDEENDNEEMDEDEEEEQKETEEEEEEEEEDGA